MLAAGALEVDAGSFDGLVTQEVGQEDDVVALAEEVLREQVPEGVWMDDSGVEAVLLGIQLEVLGETPHGDRLSIDIEEDIPVYAVGQPKDGFLP